MRVTGARSSRRWGRIWTRLIDAAAHRGGPRHIRRTRGPQASITVQAVTRDDKFAATHCPMRPVSWCPMSPIAGRIPGPALGRSSRASWVPVAHPRTSWPFSCPSDASPQEARDCLHEELAQAVGPLNDLYRLPDSVFNDDNVHTVLTGFDMLMLRARFTRRNWRIGHVACRQVAARLPGILARHQPRRSRRAACPSPLLAHATRPGSEAVQTALGPRQQAPANAASAAAQRAGYRPVQLGWQRPPPRLCPLRHRAALRFRTLIPNAAHIGHFTTGRSVSMQASPGADAAPRLRGLATGRPRPDPGRRHSGAWP